MKIMKNVILSIVLMVFITSCATKAKFPISGITPGAEITAKMKKDKNNNFRIFIEANYLASAERLSPPKKTYIIWILTKDNSIKNIGQLKSKSSKKSTFETLSSFKPVEIFITAENEGDLSIPSGTEISRTFFKR